MSKRKVRETSPITVSDRAGAWNTLKTSMGDKVSSEVSEELLEYVPWRDRLRTPSITMDIHWGGGMRPGSIVEHYGPEGTLKTWLALEMCRHAQEQYPDKSVAYIDSESRVDLLNAAENIGVAMEPFDDGTPRFEYYPKPTDPMPTLEDILNRIKVFAASGLFSLIVLDSVAACQTLIEATSEDVTHTQQMGAPLRMSIAFRSIGSLCARSKTNLWLTNQMRTTLTKGPGGMIAKKEPSGGLALKYAATHRLRTEWMERKRDEVDSELNFLFEKVKYDAPSMTTGSVPIILGHGIDREADLITVAVEQGLMQKKGSWYAFGGTNIGQGLRDAANYLKSQPHIYRSVYESIMDKLFSVPTEENAPTTKEETVT